jgi:hypothetical protein
VLYFDGLDVSKDYAKRMEWFKMTIDGGYADAKTCIPELELQGENVGEKKRGLSGRVLS